MSTQQDILNTVYGDAKPPRRIISVMQVPAEVALSRAILEVERMDADERLTNIVSLLIEAKERLSDYIDEQLK